MKQFVLAALLLCGCPKSVETPLTRLDLKEHHPAGGAGCLRSLRTRFENQVQSQSYLARRPKTKQKLGAGPTITARRVFGYSDEV